MKATLTVSSFLLLLVSPILTDAQTTQLGPDLPKWVRIKSGDISFAMPDNYLFDKERINGFQRSSTLYASANGAQMEFDAAKVDSPKRVIAAANKGGNVVQFTKGEFVGTMVSKTSSGLYANTIRLASKSQLFTFKVIGTDQLQPEVVRYLFSIRIAGQPLLQQNRDSLKASDETAILEYEALETSSEIQAVRKQKAGKAEGKIETASVEPATLEVDAAGLSRQLIIVDQPLPSFMPSLENFTNRDGIRYGSYFVKLKITFKASGQIGDIIVYTNSDKPFWSACVDAARKIKFLPAQIDGKNVDFMKVIDYSGAFATSIQPPASRRY